MKNSKHTMLNVLNFLKQHETDISHINRTAAAIFVFATFFVYVAAPAMAAGLAKITEIQGGGGASVSGGADGYKAQYEDRTIYFGNYWQTLKSGAPSNSNKLSDYDKKGIKWRVLANNTTADADGNKGVFLLSDKALYAYRFDSSSNRWEYSDIHTSLTGIVGNTKSSAKTYDELAPSFARDAFSAKEYEAIADTKHIAGILDDDHIYTGWDIENTDKLFLLSASEINNTAYGFDRTGLHERSDKRVALTTAFARHVPMYRHGRGCSVVVAWWWLRSPSGHSGFDMAYSVDESELREDNFVDGNGEVRVALNLNQESVLFLSAAVGGKSSVAVGDGFALADYTGDKSWKVTLKDISIAAPNATVTQEPTIGGVDYLAAAAAAAGTIYLTCPIEVTYDTAPAVTYTAQAITEAKANFVSAIAVNSADKYVNYAKISNSASETDKEVDFDSLADGTYKMFIFAEKENGDKQTDYASAFSSEEGYEFYKGTVIINEDELSKEYKDKDLTVRLGGGFNLIFENDIYDTEIIVAANYSGTITGEMSDIKPAGLIAAVNDITGAKITAETDGTTLTEKVTVEEKAQLACCGRIKFMDLGLDGELNIENDAIVELRGIAIGDKGVIRMKENATLINNSGEKVTVLVDISGEKQKTVTVNNGETYNSSHSGGSSSSGCNAGFGIAMLLFAAAMLRKRKR